MSARKAKRRPKAPRESTTPLAPRADSSLWLAIDELQQLRDDLEEPGHV